MKRSLSANSWTMAVAVPALLSLAGCQPPAAPVAKMVVSPPVREPAKPSPPPVEIAETPVPVAAEPMPMPEPPPIVEAPVAGAEPIVATLEAAALSRMFQESNSAEADRLLGKRVEITGYVLQVRNLGQQRLVVLGDEHFTGALPEERVLCHVEQDMSEAANITSARLRISGTCQLGYGNLIVLRNCQIEEELAALDGFEGRKLAFAAKQNEAELKNLGVVIEGEGDQLAAKLTRKHFQAGHLLPEIRTRLHDLADLRILRLSGLPISDAGLREISFLPRLHEIALDATRVSAQGLDALAGATELRRVTLDGTTQNEGFAHLANARHLESLELTPNQGYSEFSDEAVRHLASIRGLTRLNLDGARLTPQVMNWIAEQKGLRFLSLEYTRVNLDLLQQLADLSALESLSLSGSSFDDGAIRSLNELRQLITLDLSQTQLTDAGLVLYTPSPKLKELDLSGCRIVGGGLASLRGSNIESLSLRSTNADNEALIAIESLTTLKQLRLGHTGISYAALSRLATLQQLEQLDLSGIRLERESLAVLQGLGSLKQLRLSENPFADCDACLTELSQSRPGLNLYLGRYDFLAQSINPSR